MLKSDTADASEETDGLRTQNEQSAVAGKVDCARPGGSVKFCRGENDSSWEDAHWHRASQS